MTDFALRFEQFRATNHQIATRWPKVLFQLEHDPRMDGAWKSLDRHSSQSSDFDDVLAGILRLTTVLSFSDTHTMLQKAVNADYDRVATAMAEVFKFLLDVSEGNHCSSPYLRQQGDFKSQAVARVNDMGRVAAFASDVFKQSERRLGLIVSSSQKVAKHVHFSNLLCRLLQRKIGRPLYSFVAIITSLIYNLDEDYTLDSVRMAYDRDLKRRGKPKPSIRTVPAA